jgi:hypothetical protein
MVSTTQDTRQARIEGIIATQGGMITAVAKQVHQRNHLGCTATPRILQPKVGVDAPSCHLLEEECEDLLMDLAS